MVHIRHKNTINYIGQTIKLIENNFFIGISLFLKVELSQNVIN